MKLVWIGVGAFLLSLAASATAVVLTHPDAETPVQAGVDAASDQSQGHVEVQPAVDTTSVAHGAVDAAPEESASDSSNAAITESHSEPSHTEDVDTEDVDTVGPSGPIIAVSVPTTPPPQSADGTAAADSAAAVAREESARQLARVFSAMRAEDAAAVLNHMSNGEVIDVLKFLNSRQAGAVLSAMDDARAAELSRELLNGRDGN